MAKRAFHTFRLEVLARKLMKMAWLGYEAGSALVPIVYLRATSCASFRELNRIRSFDLPSAVRCHPDLALRWISCWLIDWKDAVARGLDLRCT